MARDEGALGVPGRSSRFRDMRPDAGEAFGLGLHLGKLTHAHSPQSAAGTASLPAQPWRATHADEKARSRGQPAADILSSVHPSVGFRAQGV